MGWWPGRGKQFRFWPLERAVFARDRGFFYGQGERIPRPLGACRKAGFVCAWAGQWSASVKFFRRQVSDDPQATFPAQRTRVAVERSGALGFGARLAGLLGDVEGRTDLLDALGATTVGEKAEVTDAHEALGQDMKEEAAQELLAREGHDFVAVVVAVVLVVELHLIVVEAKDPCVGQGDAVAVARQILHYRVGVGKTGLGVDHPVAGP